MRFRKCVKRHRTNKNAKVSSKSANRLIHQQAHLEPLEQRIVLNADIPLRFIADLSDPEVLSQSDGMITVAPGAEFTITIVSDLAVEGLANGYALALGNSDPELVLSDFANIATSFSLLTDVFPASLVPAGVLAGVSDSLIPAPIASPIASITVTVPALAVPGESFSLSTLAEPFEVDVDVGFGAVTVPFASSGFVEVNVPTGTQSFLSAEGEATITVADVPLVVNSDLDIEDENDGVLTLREAIRAARLSPGTDTIVFAIDSGPQTIQLSSPLPPIEDTVIINGATQPGFSGVPLIEIDGSGAGAGASGLVLQAHQGSVINSLVLNRFSDTGVLVQGGGNHHISGNYIGTDVSGTQDLGNVGDGIRIEDSASNVTIGGLQASDRNIISGNDGGGILLHDGASSNIVVGNYIGLNVTGSVSLGNARTGIFIDDSSNNTIGGGTLGARNVVSASEQSHGIHLKGSQSTQNWIAGNLIGTDSTGFLDRGNGGDGVLITDGASANTIGTNGDGIEDDTEGNILSGNQETGIEIIGSQNNVIAGNFVGTDIAGTKAIPNSGFAGVRLSVGAKGNRIGTNDDGTSDELETNLISGNLKNNVLIIGEGTEQNILVGNLIGTDFTGTQPIDFSSVSDPRDSDAADGVRIRSGASDNAVLNNVIAYHLLDGVAVWGVEGDTASSSNNRIQENSILGNDRLGINLRDSNAGEQVTPNDALDADEGPNRLQNFPVLAEAVGGILTRVEGTFESTPNAAYVIDFYLNTAADVNEHDEGEIYLGAVTIGTDANGIGNFDESFPLASTPGQSITATATDTDGNTSEFSVPAPVQLPDLIVESIDVDTNAIADQEIEVRWTIRNQGVVGFTGTIIDSVFLSDDAVTGNDEFLGFVSFTGSIPVGGVTELSRFVSIPDGITTGHYFVVATDSYGSIVETDETNNTLVDDEAIDLRAPDLVVTSVQAPNQADVGGEIEVSWTVVNQGTLGFDGSATTRLSLSDDEILGDDRFVDDVPTLLSLGIGESKVITATVGLPTAAQDENFFVVTIDPAGTITERSDENNSLLDDAPIDIASPDFFVESIEINGIASAGQTVVVSWTIRNLGNAAYSGDLTDTVFLSEDQAVGGDRPLTVHTSSDTFTVGGAISRSATVTIPDNAIGDHTLIVTTDANQVIAEVSETNNTLVDDQVLDILAPDLVVTVIDGPVEAQIGGTTGVSWTIENQGTGRFVGTIASRFLLSDDIAIGNDQFVANVPSTISLDAGEATVLNAILSLPVDVSGTQRFVAEIDPANDIPELDENNNSLLDGDSVEILASDLILLDVTAPDGAQFGDEIVVAWTVRNVGTAEAAGNITPRIWLSKDEAFGGGDLPVVVSNVTPVGDLPVAGKQRRSASVTLPLESFIPPYTYHLLVETDSNRVVLESDELNNFASSGEIEIALPPLPDLAVTDITAPAFALSNQPFEITWTISNEGGSTARGPWFESVSLVAEGSLQTSLALDPFEFNGEILPGHSVTRSRTIELPVVFSGAHLIRVETDVTGNVIEIPDIGANFLLDDVAVDIQLFPFPNLQLGEATVPADAFAGEQTVLEWTVTNVGAGSTTSPYWQDRAYLSTDSILDAGDRLLASVDNVTALSPGESYRNVATVTLPTDITGPVHFIFKTDATKVVDEFDAVTGLPLESDNELVSESALVTQPTKPNLRVDFVDAPTNGIAGEKILVRWNVRNVGLSATETDSWQDRVFLSTNDLPELTDDDILLGIRNFSGPLEPGGVGTEEATIEASLPRLVSGPHFVKVFTDFTNVVDEGLVETNNVGVDTSALEIVRFDPDLEVIGFDTPSAALSGRTIRVSYEVQNLVNSTVAGSWTDSVFLTTVADGDVSTAIARTGQRRHGNLDIGESYARTAELTIPEELEGDFYIVIKTDSSESNFEEFEDNNVQSAPIRIDFVPADLVIDNFELRNSSSGGGQLRAGDTLRASWQVANQGPGDTAGRRFTDSIVVSTDENLGNDDDRTLVTVVGAESLDVGDSAIRDALIVLPRDLSGELRFFAITDVADVVPEFDELNNSTFGTFGVSAFVLPDERDLIVQQFRKTAEVPGFLKLEWQVQNIGSRSMIATSWHDAIYLSKDMHLSDDDIELGEVLRANPLAAGAAYDASTTVRLPDDHSDEYFVLLSIDDNNVATESDESNNVEVLRSGEAGQQAPVTIDLQPVPLPDLAMTSVVAAVDGSRTAISGQPLEIAWTVTNEGVATGESWHDAVYLSRDQVFDPSDDLYLGFRRRAGGLGAGESYSAAQSFRIPPREAGPFFVFVVTGRNSDALSESNLTNNFRSDALPVSVELSEPVDFVVGLITIPEHTTAGETATITYSVTNNGENPSLGEWSDGVYLSADDQLDIDDAFFASAAINGPINPGQGYTRSVSAAIPGVLPGDYHVIVRSDIRNQIDESNEETSGEDNNISASLDQFEIDIPELEIGVARQGQLAQDQSIYFQFDAAYGEALLVSLESLSSDSANEVYVAFESPPTRGDFDFRFDAPFAANQQVQVPFAQQGTYFVLVHGGSVPEPAEFTIVVERLEYTVLDDFFGFGGTLGNRTIEINGARFDRSVNASLVDGTGALVPALAHYYVDESLLFATFDLTSVEPGRYDVIVTKSSTGQTVEIADSFEVIVGGAAPNNARIEAPEITLRDGTPFTIRWGNDGLNDVLAPLIVVRSNAPFGQDFSDLTSEGKATVFLGTSNGPGPAGILLPGQTEQRTFAGTEVRSELGFPLGFTLTVDRLVADTGLPFDWEALRDAIIPPDLTDGQFEPIFQQLVAQVGPTWGDYLEMLSRNATLLSRGLGDNRDQLNLIALEIDAIRALTGSSIVGNVIADDLQVNTMGELIAARNLDTGRLFTTISLSDGSFALTGLPTGSYSLALENSDAFHPPVSDLQVSAFDAVTGAVLLAEVNRTIQGAIRGDEDGAPVENARVSLTLDTISIAEAVTDSEGRFSFGGLAIGIYDLEVQASLRRSNTITVDLVDAVTDVAVELEVAGAIEGNVIVPAIPGLDGPVLIRAESLSDIDTVILSTLDSAGFFRIDGLAPGNYILGIIQSGVLLAETDTLSVVAGTTTSVPDLSFAGPGTVRGQVVHADPVAAGNIALSVFHGETLVAVASAESDGSFEVAGLPAGAYRLVAEAGDGTIGRVDVTVSGGGLTDNVNFQLLPGSTISGRILDGAGAPLEGITVELNGADATLATAVSDVDGNYAFNGLDIGEYTVTLAIADLAPVVPSSVSERAATISVPDFVVGALSWVEGAVQRADGTVLPNALVLLVRGDDRVSSTQTNGDGAFGFSISEPGTYRLHARGLDASFEISAPFEALSGETVNKTLVSGNASLELSVVDSGLPVADVSVSLYQNIGDELVFLGSSLSDAQGIAAYSNLSVGNYVFEAVNAAGNRAAEGALSIGGANVVLDVVLAATATFDGTLQSSLSTEFPFGVATLRSDATGLRRSALIADDGSIAFLGVVPGTYQLTVEVDQHETLVDSQQQIEGASSASFNLVPSSTTLSGRVVAAGGLPLPFAEITILDADGNVVDSRLSEFDGTFALTGASGSQLEVVVAVNGFETERLTVDLPRGQTTEIGDVQILGLTSSSAIVASGDIPQRAASQLPAANIALSNERLDAANSAEINIFDIFNFTAEPDTPTFSIVDDARARFPFDDPAVSAAVSNAKQAIREMNASLAAATFRSQLAGEAGNDAYEQLLSDTLDLVTLRGKIRRIGTAAKRLGPGSAVDRVRQSADILDNSIKDLAADLSKTPRDMFDLLDDLDEAKRIRFDSFEDAVVFLLYGKSGVDTARLTKLVRSEFDDVFGTDSVSLFSKSTVTLERYVNVVVGAGEQILDYLSKAANARSTLVDLLELIPPETASDSGEVDEQGVLQFELEAVPVDLGDFADIVGSETIDRLESRVPMFEVENEGKPYVVPSLGGIMTFVADRNFDHLAEGETFVDVIGYAASFRGSLPAEGEIEVTVHGLNDAPNARSDSYRVQADDVLVREFGTVLSNDFDVDGDELTATLVSGPSKGVLVEFNEDGSFVFDPNGQFDGLEEGETENVSFTYEASDEFGGTDSASVSITVLGKGTKAPLDPDEGPDDRERPDDPENQNKDKPNPQDPLDDEPPEDLPVDEEFTLRPPPGSADPNDIIGPAGFGPENWVVADRELPYTIRFENVVGLATGPAQVIRITQQLDDDLDFRSFRLGDMLLGNFVFELPGDRGFFVGRKDLRDKLGVFVDVFAGIDVQTGEAFWEFTAIDPQTGQVPVDARIGLLPVNNDGVEGQGFVGYTVRPKSDVASGDVVDAQATIIFDNNEPIDTPPIFNTLDAVAPSSAIDQATVSDEAGDGDILVTWLASDDSSGSAISGITVLVSENGGPMEVWLDHTTLTQAPFAGEAGRRYAFYSVARDNAGNLEPAPAVADIEVGDLESPAATLTDVAPEIRNSAVDATEITFSEPVLELGIEDLILTRDGGVNLISGDVSIESLSETVFRIRGLASLTSADGEYVLSVDTSGVLDSAANAGEEIVATAWTMDTNRPTSSVRSLARRQTSQQIFVEVDGIDEATDGTSVSAGIAEFDIFVSTDGGPFTYWQTVPADDASATFIGEDNRTYAFHSVGRDAAGNVEIKTNEIEASTFVPDVTPPDTRVTVVDTTTPTFEIEWTGSDNGGDGILVMAVFVEVDGNSPVVIAVFPVSSAELDGTHSGSLTYQAITDGSDHTYRFFSLGIDRRINIEQFPADPAEDVLVTVAFTDPAQLEIVDFDVENGATQRSFVQELAVTFNQSAGLQDFVESVDDADPNNDRIRLLRFDLDGSGTGDPISLSGQLEAIDQALEFDFGPGGIGGDPLSSSGDGYYQLEIDLDGDGTFETTRNFYRLLGDVNGDRIVDNLDILAITLAFGNVSTDPLLDEDVNGDGVVNAIDRVLAARNRGQQLGLGLVVDD